VVRRGDEWAVIGENNSKDTAHFDTQKESEQKAIRIAENQGGDVIIHGRNGKIRERNTYGKPDYFPPRG